MQASAPASKLDAQGSHALLSTGISFGLGLLLSILVSRALGPAGKGLLDLTSATAALFALVLGGSLNVALTHLVARHGTIPSGLVAQLAAWAGGAAAITAGWFLVVPDFSVRLGLLPPADHRFWIGFIVVTVGFGIWSAGLRGMLIGRHALIAANRIDLGVKGALLLSYLALVITSGGSPTRFAIAGAGSAILLSFCFLHALRGATGKAAPWWSLLLATSLPMHGTNILHFINQRADLFFVQAFHGVAEVGRYALAVSLAQCVLFLSSALAQPLLPQISAAPSAPAAAEMAARICRLFVALGLLASAGLVLGGTWLVPLLFGRDFSRSLPPLFILLPGMLGFGLTNILISYFAGIDRSRINLWISLAALTVTLVGNAWLTRQHGAFGAAATSTLAYGLAGAISVHLFARRTGLSLGRVVQPLVADWRAAFALVARFRL